MDKMLKTVLKEITPDTDLKTKAKKFASELNTIIRSNHIKARCVIGGSVAKDTYLKNDCDVDLFVLFDLGYKSVNLSDLLEKCLIKWSYERVHGSRDYFQINSGVTYEIVPVLDIKNKASAQNVTDFSPMHVEWVKSNKKYVDDIRLSKQFFKANNLYGAESYVKGSQVMF